MLLTRGNFPQFNLGKIYPNSPELNLNQSYSRGFQSYYQMLVIRGNFPQFNLGKIHPNSPELNLKVIVEAFNLTIICS